MSENSLSKIKSTFELSIEVKNKILEDNIYEVLQEAGDLIVDSILEGGKLLICGNGGSASDAQHLVAEFLVRLNSDVNRQGLPAMSLLQDTSTITACLNDYNSDEIFSRNLETLSSSQDVLLVISTSGNSPNIIKTLESAKMLKLKSIGFLGNNGGKALSFCDVAFVVPSKSIARIQEAHITAGHATLQYIEDKLMERDFLRFREDSDA